MKEFDDIIKNALLKNMQRINDDSFTENIIKDHLSKKTKIKYKPFLNFVSLIIGLSFVFISIGFILLIRNNFLNVETIELNEQHGLILFALSFVFLIYKWLEDYIASTST
jgi:predicted neutral ceramidase superfamily lipid hydrolase